MTSLTFYGGIGEVGGNKILLESDKTRVFFDFGMSFSRMGMFYDEFMNPRKLNGLGDFFEIGLLPDLKGLYRCDFLKKCSRDDFKPRFDGIFLTHAHVDHSGFIPLINEKIPIYCGETTKLILKAMQDTGSGYETEFIEMKEHFTGLHYTKVPHYMKQVNSFRTGAKVKVKDIEVVPVHVDHSIPGAYGYIIHTGGKTIVYSGDIRMHGTRADLTEDFVNAAAKEKVDALIVEGTRVTGEKSMSEPEVKQKISSIIAGTKGLVLANFPPRDIDRIRTFYEAAVENDRKLVINLKQAYLLQALENDRKLTIPRISDKNIMVYVRRKGDGNYDKKEYFEWERPFLELKNSVKASELEQKKAVFYCDSYSLGELIDIRPPAESSYIYSLCEPFNDVMELDMKRLKNWIRHFRIKYHEAHASGHCSREELKEAIERINPKKVFPIHTEQPLEFKEIAKGVEIKGVGEEIKI